MSVVGMNFDNVAVIWDIKTRQSIDQLLTCDV